MRYTYRSLQCQVGGRRHDSCPGTVWRPRNTITGPGYHDCDCPCHTWQTAEELLNGFDS